MFSHISLAGYKSFKQKVDAELKPLTILAGANSSGKSSLIQPLLLFKQTLLTGSDPGPLRLDGPNVIFSRSDQLFWHAPNEETNRFEVEIAIHHKPDIKVSVVFQKRKEPRGLPAIQIESTRWLINDEMYEFFKKRKVSSELYEQVKKVIKELFLYESNIEIDIVRQRCFLIGIVKIGGAELIRLPFQLSIVEDHLKKIIHVPGLRGNPERTYPVRAIGNEFPGLFQDYVASIIAYWQRQRKDKLAKLNEFLLRTGLTWKVRAYQKSDTEVEIQVGRTNRSLRGGAKDLVNIADVGFGVSQSLPILVALLAATPGQLVYIEQPEIHLHPEAQVILAELISETVMNGIQVIVETHSHLLLMAFQRAILKKILPVDKAILHWFNRNQRGVTGVSTTTFKDDGSFENVDIPIDFADISIRLMYEYLHE